MDLSRSALRMQNMLNGEFVPLAVQFQDRGAAPVGSVVLVAWDL